MTEKPKTETANDIVEHQLDTLSSNNVRLQKANDALVSELNSVKKQNTQLGSVIENQLKADLKIDIRGRSDYKDSDLESMTYAQLKQIDDTLSRTKGGDTATYKSIHAGNDTQTGRTTVGDLYGKTRKEILDLKGEF